MEHRIDSEGVALDAHLAEPKVVSRGRLPGLVICHGFPIGTGGARVTGRSYHELADRIARDMNWVVIALTYRGCGDSEGEFSLRGWYADTCAAVDDLLDHPAVNAAWIAGFGTGGALGLAAAADDDRVRGVAAVAPPADFDDWGRNPRHLLVHARQLGAVRSDDFPLSFDDWASELGLFRAVDGAAAMAPRPLLLLQGSDDDAVPVFDARVIADAHGSADLRIISGAGHGLRYDPRAIAVLLGWLDRQHHRSAV